MRSTPEKHSPSKALFATTYGPRLDTHNKILEMSVDELHTMHPYTTKLVFDERTRRGDFDMQHVPVESCIYGSQRWVIGNER